MRLVPDIALPMHAHTPTTGSVPDLVPLEMAKRLAPAAVVAAEWKKNKTYLYGHDLMRAGYYWEAHEVWEAVWQVAGANSPERVLLQALIQGANAQLKRKMGRFEAAGKLDIQVEELRVDLSARLGGHCDSFMGVNIADQSMYYNA